MTSKLQLLSGRILISFAVPRILVQNISGPLSGNVEIPVGSSQSIQLIALSPATDNVSKLSCSSTSHFHEFAPQKSVNFDELVPKTIKNLIKSRMRKNSTLKF